MIARSHPQLMTPQACLDWGINNPHFLAASLLYWQRISGMRVWRQPENLHSR